MLVDQATRVLVIGYGNTLRGDDGVGRIVAEQLAEVIQSEQVDVLSCHQLTVELAEEISQAHIVILIDAAVGDTPGAIACEEVLPSTTQPTALLHYMEPGVLLASTHGLYGTCPTMFLWTVVGESFEYGEQCSPSVQQVIPDLLQRLVPFVEQFVGIAP